MPHPSLKKLDCLVLLSDDLRRTEDFYRRAGFTIEKSDSKAVVVRLADFYIHFHQTEEYRIGFRRDFPVSGPKGTGVQIFIEANPIREYHASLIAAGLIPYNEVEMTPWGNLEFALKDPDGYMLLFYELPEKKVDVGR